jgi:hypothetical protein
MKKAEGIVKFTCCQGLSIDTIYFTPPLLHRKITVVATEKVKISIFTPRHVLLFPWFSSH